MKNTLINKQIILGVTGGIAAYKSADLARRLRECGAIVRVVMTPHAKEFITPLTLQAVSGNPVHDELFDLQAEAAMGHIELARWADAILIAPASADFIARLAHGEANDLLTTLCLAAKSPIAVAPAMNQGMWKNPLTEDNVQALVAKGIHVFGPGEGSQACGDTGPGRMLEPAELLESLAGLFTTGSLSGQHVLITAGPTREAIDPVRYITNASSGKMGYALASAAIEAGARVTLVSGPVSLPVPDRVRLLSVITAQDMFDAVMAEVAGCDIFLSVAAVADYHCKTISPQKIAKTAESLTLSLMRNPDILATVAALPKRPFVVGFAAETENLLANATAKLKNKKLDMIIANQVGDHLGFEQDDNAVVVITEEKQQAFSSMAKPRLARELISYISEEVKKHERKNGSDR
ncbi:MAG TPA: bifunctional phosphopantothenoylcysteine decarboxylase/phosphopantothenate--cysteine ligase CoaBC [Gammaproteobacteria bacterium]|nr:bifunctional phosphopantothenoylcysteine decarboxylase/phosphopantothenate--cysteine ligase CoaBC [Gammaproteobacteria bacterium]